MTNQYPYGVVHAYKMHKEGFVPESDLREICKESGFSSQTLNLENLVRFFDKCDDIAVGDDRTLREGDTATVLPSPNISDWAHGLRGKIIFIGRTDRVSYGRHGEPELVELRAPLFNYGVQFEESNTPVRFLSLHAKDLQRVSEKDPLHLFSDVGN